MIPSVFVWLPELNLALSKRTSKSDMASAGENGLKDLHLTDEVEIMVTAREHEHYL